MFLSYFLMGIRAGMAGEAAIGGLAAAGAWKYFVQGGSIAIVSEVLFAAFCIYVATQATKTEVTTSAMSSEFPEFLETSRVSEAPSNEGSTGPPENKGGETEKGIEIYSRDTYYSGY